MWTMAGQTSAIASREPRGPSAETIALCEDRAACSRVLERAGVPTPSVRRVTGPESLKIELEELLTRHERVCLRAARATGPQATLAVTSVHQAESWVAFWRAMRGLRHRDFILSEALPGATLVCQTVWHDGALVTSLTDAGPDRDEVHAIATGAVRALSGLPHGAFSVRLRDNAAGIPCVTDVRPGRLPRVAAVTGFVRENGGNRAPAGGVPHEEYRDRIAA
jgi:carbamoyl-phosphate synthase large subunit